MKAKELILILQKNPEADIKIGWEELVQYSELTSGSEDHIEPVRTIYYDGSEFVFSFECYLALEKVWSNE